MPTARHVRLMFSFAMFTWLMLIIGWSRDVIFTFGPDGSSPVCGFVCPMATMAMALVYPVLLFCIDINTAYISDRLLPKPIVRAQFVAMHALMLDSTIAVYFYIWGAGHNPFERNADGEGHAAYESRILMLVVLAVTLALLFIRRSVLNNVACYTRVSILTN